MAYILLFKIACSLNVKSYSRLIDLYVLCTADFPLIGGMYFNSQNTVQCMFCIGFKCEWMTVRDGVLWVGGLGKEWTTTLGVVENYHPQWVKTVGYLGDVQHHDWISKYNALRKKGGFMHPGLISVI